MIRLPLRGDVKQAEVVTRVFDALCQAESGTVSTLQTTTDKGEACDPISKDGVGARLGWSYPSGHSGIGWLWACLAALMLSRLTVLGLRWRTDAWAVTGAAR